MTRLSTGAAAPGFLPVPLAPREPATSAAPPPSGSVVRASARAKPTPASRPSALARGAAAALPEGERPATAFSNDERLKAPRRFSSEGGVLSLALREPDGSSVGGEGRGDESPSSIATSASKATTARRSARTSVAQSCENAGKKTLVGSSDNGGGRISQISCTKYHDLCHSERNRP